MDTAAAALAGPAGLELAIASAAPVSLDRLVAWNLARPSDLWRWLEDAARRGLVAEDGAAGPACFAFRDEQRRSAVLAGAAPAAWQALLALDGALEAVIASARRDLQARRFEPAQAALRQALRAARPGTFPGGPRGFVEALAECVRVFAFTEAFDAALLEEGLAIAVAHGDLRRQAVLAAARGFAATRTPSSEPAQPWFDRALEAAAATGDRGAAFEVHVRIAFGHVVQGRPHDAIATFERFLGDVPEEFLPLPPELAPPFSALPEAPLGVLGSIYGQVGQYGRGMDMLHRMCAVGERLERPELVALGRTFLSGLHGGRRELDRLRATAEPAFAYWRATGSEPWLLWHAAQQLGLARVAEGRFGDARAVLEAGQRARAASGTPYFGGSALYEALDRLEAEGVAAPEGLDLGAEIDRMRSWPGAYMRGVASRYAARRLARAGADGSRAAERDRLHAESVALLRASRASPVELARALDEAAAWAARCGRTGEADRLAAEARELFVSLDLAPRAAEDAGRAASALVELGRLGALGERREGAWGELAARLCEALAVERCALVEATGEGPRPLAARGGSPRWLLALVALAARRSLDRAEALEPVASGEEPPAPGGQLLVVPFASARLGRRGWAFLENRHSRPSIRAEDAALLQIVEAQLGVVLENVTLWQELIAARQRLEGENRYHREAAPSPARRGRFVGDSPALREVLALVERVAPATTTVLVTGETGVGKDLVARELHRLSPRADKPFIAVHIASMAPGLVASGLFGHERGAFTGATDQARGRFELADGGTLFLDEIGELGPEDQVRLLRVLQEGTFERVGGTRPIRSDFRLVAATNRDLAAEVKAGRFREDLYFRLATFPIRVPPLRERKEEIPTLALFFMETFGRKHARRFEGLREADMARLVAHAWPGNVRELEHLVERAVILSDPPALRIPPLGEGAAPPPADGGELVTLEEAERRHIRRVIAHTSGRITGPGGAAELLGMKPSTLSWRIGKLGLKAEVARARLPRA